jgi:hypothetical protein
MDLIGYDGLSRWRLLFIALGLTLRRAHVNFVIDLVSLVMGFDCSSEISEACELLILLQES